MVTGGAGAADLEELLEIRDEMVSRGPDSAGLYRSPCGHVGLAHRRLSIIDISSTGHQPMSTPEGRYSIVFNGEIYNYKALREELRSAGVTFQSHSDTEVLLHLYAKEGPSMLGRLRGMFAFAIWDTRERTLFAATDPFGIKPFYFAWDGTTLRFASQVRALLRSRHVDSRPNAAAHAGFLLWGSVPEPHTMFAGIRALGAGRTLTVTESGRMTESVWCSVATTLAHAAQNPFTGTKDEAAELIRAALSESVAHHLEADVPVDVFLSSGRDSTTIAALASESQPGNINTLTLAFREFVGTKRDESPLAEEVAHRYGTRHRTLWVDGSSFREDLMQLMEAMDQPTIDAINTYFVSKAVAATGAKVALSGVGGDELFAGYPSFHQVPKAVRLMSPLGAFPIVGRGFRKVTAGLFQHRLTPKMAGIIEYGTDTSRAYLLRRGLFMPWELPEVMDADMAAEGWRNLNLLGRLEDSTAGMNNSRLEISSLEAEWYMRNMLLRDSDWASMAHSLEIRTPLVDIELWRKLAPIAASASGLSKDDLCRTPSRSLPDSVINRPKTGFEIPLVSWLGNTQTRGVNEPPLRSWARHVHFTYQMMKPRSATVAELHSRRAEVAAVMPLMEIATASAV